VENELINSLFVNFERWAFFFCLLRFALRQPSERKEAQGTCANFSEHNSTRTVAKLDIVFFLAAVFAAEKRKQHGGIGSTAKRLESDAKCVSKGSDSEARHKALNRT